MEEKKHARRSPSAAHRWLVCTACPALEGSMPDMPSVYAAEGTLAHGVCEIGAKVAFGLLSPDAGAAHIAVLRGDPQWNEEMVGTADVYIKHLSEQAAAFASPPYAAFEVRVDLGHLVPGCFGTCDAVMVGGDTLIVTDYKHGKGVAVEAEGNPQLRLYALGALRKYAPLFGGSIRRVRTVIDQPRLGSYSVEDMTVEALLAWGVEVADIVREADETGGVFRAGEHCRFCKARAVCRERAESAARVQQAPPGMLTDTEVGEMLCLTDRLMAWCNDLREYALTACLEGRVIPGWKVVEGRSTRAWADQDAAFAALQAGGFDAALLYDRVPKTLAQVEKTVGKAQFEALVGGYVLRPPGKPTLAPEKDRRPAYSRAAADFAGVTG